MQSESDLEISPTPPPPNGGQVPASTSVQLPPQDPSDSSNHDHDEKMKLNRSRTERLRMLQDMTEKAGQDYVMKDRHMKLWDVVALNVNTMIGTGIFTTPGLILTLTRSKALSLTFWFAGGLYAMLGVYVYGRYSKYIPYNGGEFLWLDTVFKRPRFFWAIVVGGSVLVLETTTGNCLAFAKHVSLVRDAGAKRTQDFHRDSVGYIGVSVLTLVCFIHFFSPRAALMLNKWFAFGKCVFLLVIIIAGIQAGIRNGRDGERVADWGWYHDEMPKVRNVLSAFIYVLYSYMGWQTAFTVAGEVGKEQKPESKILRHGSAISVAIVSVLYVLVTLAYSIAIPFEAITGDDVVGADLSIIVNFFPKAFGTSDTQWAKMLIALSAFGYLISTVFASSRVNQQIYRQRFFPLYQIFDRDNPYYKTPAGGLFVHWFFTTLTILVAPNTEWGYGFVINIKSYGRLFITFLLSIGILFIHRVKRERLAQTAGRNRTGTQLEDDVGSNKENETNSQTEYGGAKKSVLFSALLLVLLSLFLLIVSAAGRTDAYPAVWLWPVALAVVYGAFSIHWAIMRTWMYLSEKYPDSGWSSVRVYRYRDFLEYDAAEPPAPQPPPGPIIDGGKGPTAEKGPTSEVIAKSSHLDTLSDYQRNRLKTKLELRFEKYGQDTLLVYHWTKPTRKILERYVYYFLGISIATDKPLPTLSGGSILSDGIHDRESAYTMASPRFRNSIFGDDPSKAPSSLRVKGRVFSFEPPKSTSPVSTTNQAPRMNSIAGSSPQARYTPAPGAETGPKV